MQNSIITILIPVRRLTIFFGPGWRLEHPGSLNLSYVKTVFALALELQSHYVAMAQYWFSFELYCIPCCFSIMHVMTFERITATAYLPSFRASAS